MAINHRDGNSRAQVRKRDQQAKFILCVRGVKDQLPMTIRYACDAVGISRQTYHAWRSDDPEFARAVDEAKEDATDVLETEAVRRAMGFETDVFNKDGDHTGTRFTYSDRMLELMLLGRRSELRSNQTMINVQNNVNQNEPSPEVLARAMALIMEEAKRKTIASNAPMNGKESPAWLR